MRAFDFGIVGLGLAGLSIGRYLEKKGYEICFFDDSTQQSSLVAGGVWNPVVLKRFTPIWRASSILDHAKGFYKTFEDDFGFKVTEDFDTCRILASVEEQNNFIAASSKPVLERFLDPKIKVDDNKGVSAEFGLGRVKETGRLNVAKSLEIYKEYLESEGRIFYQSCDYQDVQPDRQFVYQDDAFRCNQMIFCEGFGMSKNPFFNYLPLKHSKGEVLKVKVPGLNLDYLLKAGVFLLPLGEDEYFVGATYNWTDTSNSITEEARQNLVEKLNPMISTPFEIINQNAGVRPTVIDRRPLVGQHPKHKKLWVLNGLGTRGVLNGPLAADYLIKKIEGDSQVDTEMDISRFSSLYPGHSE